MASTTPAREKYAGSTAVTALVLMGLVAAVAVVCGSVSLQNQANARSAAVTEEVVGQVADRYLAEPFSWSLSLRQYRAVRDGEQMKESQDQRQLFALGSQRLALMVSREAQIYNSARLAPEGAEPFLRKNIKAQSDRLLAIIEKQGASVPPGHPSHRAMMSDLLELEAWYRALSAVQTNQTLSPAQTDLGSLFVK
jgi:hypothetical protein